MCGPHKLERTGFWRGHGSGNTVILMVKYVNYAFRLSGPVTALRARTRAKSIQPRISKLRIRQVHKLLICTLINKPLIIIRRNFSKANMNLSHLPLELLGLILANIFPNEWNHYNSGLEVLNLRTVCRKYLKRVF
jgi:hypothetical protein